MTRSINAELNSYALVSATTFPWRGGAGSGTGSPTTSFNTAATFYFVTQPSGATDEDVLVTQPVLQARNVIGNDIAVSGINVALSLGSGSTVAALTGVLGVLTDSGGRSTFTNVVVNSSNSTIGVVVVATPNGGQPQVNSTAFQVNQKYVPPPSGAGIGPGPNIPAGLAQSFWSVYDGSTHATGVENQYGQLAAGSGGVQCGISMQTVTAPESPNTSGVAMTTGYWGSDKSRWPLCMKDGQGGGVPNRWRQSTFSAASSSGVSSGFSEVYVRAQIRYQGNPWLLGWNTSVSSSLSVVYGSGTTNSLTSANASWVTDQFAGMFLKKNAFNVTQILSNTTNRISVFSSFPENNFSGEQFRLMSWSTDSTSTSSGYNVGNKLWFWRINAEVGGSGSITIPNGTVIPWSVATRRVDSGDDGTYYLNFNDFTDGVRLVQSGATVEALSFCYKQQQHAWTGNSSDSSGGYVGTWDATNHISFGGIDWFPNVGPDNLGYRVDQSQSSIFDVEMYMKMNSASGVSDGIMRIWVDGVSRVSISTARYCPDWAMYRVEAGVTDYTVPLRTANPRFREIFHDGTYGGGARIPQSSETVFYYGMFMAGR